MPITVSISSDNKLTAPFLRTSAQALQDVEVGEAARKYIAEHDHEGDSEIDHGEGEEESSATDDEDHDGDIGGAALGHAGVAPAGADSDSDAHTLVLGKSPPRSDSEDDMEEADTNEPAVKDTDLEKKNIDKDIDGESMSDADDMPNVPAGSNGDTGMGFNLAALAVPPLPPDSMDDEKLVGEVENEKTKEPDTRVTPPKRAGPTLEPASTMKKPKTARSMDKRNDSEDARRHNGGMM